MLFIDGFSTHVYYTFHMYNLIIELCFDSNYNIIFQEMILILLLHILSLIYAIYLDISEINSYVQILKFEENICKVPKS